MTQSKSFEIAPSSFGHRWLLALLAAVLLVTGGGNSSMAQEESADHPFARKFKAPALDGGVEWINTAGPIDLKELRGKFVFLDFWTYCCINCMHILPELKKLEHAYPNEVVVIGVHSAKFDNERDSKNIREAIERYGIEHPVVNDAGHVIWNKYEVQSWPTLCVIDPEGNLVARNSGEVDFETLDGFLKKVMPFYRANGLIKPSPPPLTGVNAGMQAPDTVLRYPGKVLADEKSDRLFIADSSHNRIVITKLDGTLIDVIGSGQIGAADGDYATATFDHPQGMALDDKDNLYVADTENHLIRKVDLKKKHVATIAGTGKQARPAMAEFVAGAGAGKLVTRALKAPLNSPWALWLRGKELYIAMAGPHQIWRMALARNEIGPFAGNGREDIVDGPHLPAAPYEMGASSFAQPSGLASDGKVLYVADSEGSSIRAVPFDNDQPVTTVVGTSWSPMGRLFLYGDVDGQGQLVRLQHALGVLYHDNLLYVADTYNNKIKVVDPRAGTSLSLVGTGKPGNADSPAEFDEPAGLAYAAGKLYVADTNNHAIRTIDLKTKQVATLNIPGLSQPAAPEIENAPSFPDAEKIDSPAVTIKPLDGKIRLQVELTLPAGFKINPLAPLRYLVQARGEAGPISRVVIGALERVETPATTFDIELPVSGDGTEKLDVTVAYYYCQEGSEGICKAGSVVWKLPVTVSAAATESAATLKYSVKS
jgi:sugar lactone lactonase YvrE